MTDSSAYLAEPVYFVTCEMDAMRDPGVLAEPAAVLQIIQWPHAVELMTVAVFILRFGEMCMQSNAMFFG